MSFFEIFRKCTIFHWNVNYVSDGSYWYVKIIFQHACRNGIKITLFWRWAQRKLFNFIFWRTCKNVHFGSNFWFFCTCGIFCTLSGNLERIVSILSTKYIEKWSQSDFTDVNSDKSRNSMQNVIYWIPKATGIFCNTISQLFRFSFCHPFITQVALMFVTRTI